MYFTIRMQGKIVSDSHGCFLKEAPGSGEVPISSFAICSDFSF